MLRVCITTKQAHAPLHVLVAVAAQLLAASCALPRVLAEVSEGLLGILLVLAVLESVCEVRAAHDGL